MEEYIMNKKFLEFIRELLNQVITDASVMHIDEVEGEHYFSRNRILTREKMINNARREFKQRTI